MEEGGGDSNSGSRTEIQRGGGWESEVSGGSFSALPPAGKMLRAECILRCLSLEGASLLDGTDFQVEEEEMAAKMAQHVSSVPKCPIIWSF